MEKEVIQLPFRGARNYLYGADLVLTALQQDGRDWDRVRFSGYKMILTSTVERAISDTPLSPKEYESIIRIDHSNGVTDIGFRTAPAQKAETRVECHETEFDKYVTSGDMSARVLNPSDSRTSLLPLLILTIKRSSQENFPNRVGKWIFARCDLKALPKDWRSAEVRTTVQESARFFNWTVEVDSTAYGSIVFFNVEGL